MEAPWIYGLISRLVCGRHTRAAEQDEAQDFSAQPRLTNSMGLMLKWQLKDDGMSK